MKNYKLILEGHFKGSKEYWKQEFEFETLDEVKKELKRTDYEKYEAFKITRLFVNI